MNKLNFSIVLMVTILFLSCKETKKEAVLNADEARDIAKEAYIFAYPMLMGYQAQHQRL